MKYNNLIEISNLKKYFFSDRFKKYHKNVLKGVDGISLSIKKGSIMGLIGESGCGKSTVGKTILMLENPNGGSVRYKERILFDVENGIYIQEKEMSKLRKELQIVFQDPYSALNPKQSIGKIISEGVIKHGIVSSSDVKLYSEDILKMCGLSPTIINHFPHEFSGGQRQRIVIARALAVKPEFIVCDEPTSALDVAVQSQILNLMLDLREKMNLTYLFISHNIDVIKNMCDEVAVMYLGKIVELTTAQELCSNPAHPYTQALISSIPKKVPWEKKVYIGMEGSIPFGTHIPNGCRFHTRCRYAKEICRIEEPPFKAIQKAHCTACHLYT